MEAQGGPKEVSESGSSPAFRGILGESVQAVARNSGPLLSTFIRLWRIRLSTLGFPCYPPMEPETHFGKIGLALGLLSGALSMLAVGMIQLGRRPETMQWGMLLLLLAAACYACGLVSSAIGLRRDDSRTYAKAGLILTVVIALPLLPVWLGAISLLLAGPPGR